MPRIHCFLIALPLVALPACDDPPLPVCPDNITITISSGTVPEFSWRPACLVASLGVADYDAAKLIWNVGMGRNSLAPPVRYGIAPDGTVDVYPPDVPPELLQAGRVYLVDVTRIDGTSEHPIAVVQFTP